jgi:hypothetical protein
MSFPSALIGDITLKTGSPITTLGDDIIIDEGASKFSSFVVPSPA